MLKIYPYKKGSRSVRALKDALDAVIIKLENSRYRYRNGHTILNWGNSTEPSWMTDNVPMLNQPHLVAVAANKLETLDVLSEADVPTVEYTEMEDMAREWLEAGDKVFVRHSLNGHSGDGIEVLQYQESEHDLDVMHAASVIRNLGYTESAEAILELRQDTQDNVPVAPLYTRGINNHGEYRVHVFGGEVILYQKKSRRIDEDGEVQTPDGEEADVRNLESNWIYRTGNLKRLERVEQLAIDAIDALGLDFGAVDIIMDNNGDVFVLEVNTAPGLGNKDTLDAYTDAINNYLS